MPGDFCTRCGTTTEPGPDGVRSCPRCDSRGGPPRTHDGTWFDAAPRGRIGILYADDVTILDDGSVLAADAPPPDHRVRVPHRSTEVRMRVGTYDVLGELGRGAMGVVYRAYSLRLRRTCAIKVLTGGERSSDLEVRRFQNEAMLAARLDHPNIVRIFDAGEDRGLYYFVMEYIDARPFSTWMGRTGTAGLREGLLVISKVARALDHAHRQGIVHRDVKPDNILVDPNGEPHITDFGIAKTLEQDTGLTFAGRPVGTPWYMPPEQANGELRNIGPLSDVYSLGATMYHLLAGAPPFGGDNPLLVMMDVIRREPDRPSEVARRQLGRELPPDLEAICLRAMEKDAGRRYPSAGALADDVDAWLAGHPVSVRAPSPAERLRKRLDGNRSILAAGSILILSLGLLTTAFGAVILFNMQRTNESLLELGRRAGVEQAETLDRAVRASMLHEDSDTARMLVERIRSASWLNDLEVLRPDGTPAWSGPSPSVLHPARTAPADARVTLPRRHPVVGGDAWVRAIAERRVQVQDETIDGDRVLTVVRPLINNPVCMACHDGAAEGDVLAVLVSRRSMASVEKRIQENQRATIIVGLSTSVVVVLLMYVLSRLFGIGLRPREFGRRARRERQDRPGHDTVVDNRKPVF